MRDNRLRHFETNDPFHCYNFARLGENLKCDMNWQNPPGRPIVGNSQRPLAFSPKTCGSGGIRTHASEETGA